MVTASKLQFQYISLVIFFGKLLDFVDCCVVVSSTSTVITKEKVGDYTLFYASNLLVNLLTNILFFEWKIAMQTLFIRCHFHQDSLNSSYFINCKSVSETE